MNSVGSHDYPWPEGQEAGAGVGGTRVSQGKAASTRVSPEEVEPWRKQDARASVHGRMGWGEILCGPSFRHPLSLQFLPMA